MNRAEWRQHALARAQAALFAMSEASQALIDARRASETAADWEHTGKLGEIVDALWPLREKAQKVYNDMVAGRGFGEEIRAAIEGAEEREPIAEADAAERFAQNCERQNRERREREAK